MKKTLILLFLLTFQNLSAQKITLQSLRCEYRKNPVGIDGLQPRLSWILNSTERGTLQTTYLIQVANSLSELKSGKNLLWDSGEIKSDKSIQVVYAGKQLVSRQRCYWQVKIKTNKGNSAWSEPAFWEMGLLQVADWSAQWIESEIPEDVSKPQPAQLFRKEFKSSEKIVSARAYITSHGLYEAFLNGKRIGDELFTPGWTSYNKRLQYQVYDVTNLLQNGQNAVGVMLGEGWFRGELAWENQRNNYGSKLALLFQLEIKYASGKSETIGTDNSWKSATGAILTSEIYDGEVYDARLEKQGWHSPNFNDPNWITVKTVTIPKEKLVASGLQVKKIEEISPKRLLVTPQGDTVLDFGQNMVGWVKLKAQGRAGTKIKVLHTEILDKHGNFYTENLRNAAAKLEYTLKGTGEETYEPHFTFMGFRYVAIKNYPGKLDLSKITGVVIHSDIEKTGEFECSNPLLNQLQHNIQWGQKSNFLDVPTDCPQRDERLGWTGDAEVFAPTAAYNYNVAPFFTKWMKDLAADQTEEGMIPAVIPDVLHAKPIAEACGWADAATIIPFEMYLRFDDIKILETQYPSMKAWVDFMKKNAGDKFIRNTGFHFGDWLYFNSTDAGAEAAYSDKDFLATAFFAHSTDILRKTAKILGKTEDEKLYSELYENIKKAFQKEFITSDGRTSPNTQTAYTLALVFDLMPENQKANAAERLAGDIKRRETHISSGFLGTPHIARALSENGQLTTAYDLLLQESYPSWLFPVKMGATTIWERWDGQKPDSTFQTKEMNSFNHYAYGAIGNWMYTTIAGIILDPEQPGYKHFFIQPQPDKRISSAKAVFQSPYGKIVSDWKVSNGTFTISVNVPPNSIATLRLPKADLQKVTESGKPLTAGNGILDTKQNKENAEIKLGSGNYNFAYLGFEF